jgi:hypothetical protein
MITKVPISIFLAVLICACSSYSQQVYSPERGSAERIAILEALRVPVERDLKQKIVFVVNNLNVSGTWAYVGGRPQTPSGLRPVLKGTVFEGEEDMFDNNFFGLLRKRNGKWRVIAHALGCTDVCYADWWRRYNAPKSIFPYTE